MKKRFLVLPLSLLLLLALLAFAGLFHPRRTEVGERLEPFTVLPHEAMAEVSGLVASGRYEGVLWAHNDSGNEPRLFALNLEGELVKPEGTKGQQGIELRGASLVDWEAICRLGTKLYVTDMGNNLNARRDLGVYQFEEPDPRQSTSLEAERFIPVRYPEQKSFPPRGAWHYDCEAAFALDGNLYFVTKNRPAFRLFVQEGSAHLYRLSLKSADEDNPLESVDSVDGLEGWVTAADITPDGRWLALLCESPVQSIWLFERPAEGDRFFTDASSVRRFIFHEGGQLESLAFVGEELLMINEEREMFRVPMERFVEVVR